MLTIRDLKKSMGGRVLFEDASMQINCGESVGDLETRNTDIRMLDSTFDYIASQAGKIVRLGDPSMPLCSHPAVIDYARSELLDTEAEDVRLTVAHVLKNGFENRSTKEEK